MKFSDWFRPGIWIKRWILLGLFGILTISYGLSYLLRQVYMTNVERILSISLIGAGCIFIFYSVKYVSITILEAIANSGFKMKLDSDRLKNLLIEKRILIKGPKIVAIGGGTGLSTMLRGLKIYSSNLVAVVTVADDGGGSGILRQDLGILPPGDIRNCVLALADTEPIMEQLLQYRFKDGMLKGQSFGNLFLAAMDGISDSFEDAVKKMSDVLAVTGKVLPVTLENVKLRAVLEDGHHIHGESNIGRHNDEHEGKIKQVYLEPEHAKPLTEVIDAIMEADVVVMGPGSLYTSIIPNLLVDGMAEALQKTKAIKVYVCNIMTQPGETDHYTVSDHISAIEKHSFKGLVNYCVVNNMEIPEHLTVKYKGESADKVIIDYEELKNMEVTLIQGDFLSIEKNLARHNHHIVSEVIINLVAEKVLTQDKKRVIDYYYIREQLKK